MNIHAAVPFLAMTVVAGLKCPPEGFSSIQDFDLDSFMSVRWFIQQQMETKDIPASWNHCVQAEYKMRKKPGVWNYKVAVYQHAEEADGTVHDTLVPGSRNSYLCAKIKNAKRGQLVAAPCKLPPIVSGPYWVLAYSKEEGYALVSGGPPTVAAAGGCRTGRGIVRAGLWIFTRQQQRNATLVKEVRQIAAHKGLDLSVLNDVNQTHCTKPIIPDHPRPVPSEKRGSAIIAKEALQALHSSPGSSGSLLVHPNQPGTSGAFMFSAMSVALLALLAAFATRARRRPRMSTPLLLG